MKLTGRCAACNSDIDWSAIPDSVFYSEFGRRRGAKNQNRRGGKGGDAVWAKHNPKAPNGCRCADCRAKRTTLAMPERPDQP